MQAPFRRRFLRRASQLLAGLVTGAVLPVRAGETDTTRLQGAPVSAYGTRSRFATIARWITPSRFPTSTASWTPLAKCLDDVILAYAQNGEALRPEQGYPLRLLAPGWEGGIGVKWLRRLKFTDMPYYTRGNREVHQPAAGRARA